LPVVVLPSWYDVDDAEALRTLRAELFDGRPFRRVGARPTPAVWTRRQLAALLETSDLAARLDGVPAASRVA